MSLTDDFTNERQSFVPHSLARQIYDAHCHYHLNTSQEGLEGMRELTSRLGRSTLMATRPNEWERLSKLPQDLSRTNFLLGIHPWFAHHYAQDFSWLERLKTLAQQETCMGIGEIGLDKHWRPPDTGKVEYADQMKVFQAQFELAGELGLPVSVHCVHAQGDLYQNLSEVKNLPPAIYLHAFGGAAGTVEQLVRSKRFGSRLYFGFASCISLRSRKAKAAIKAVPDDRLLVESDRGSASSPQKITTELQTMLKVFAEVKAWSGIEEAAQITFANAQRCYRL